MASMSSKMGQKEPRWRSSAKFYLPNQKDKSSTSCVFWRTMAKPSHRAEAGVEPGNQPLPELYPVQVN